CPPETLRKAGLASSSPTVVPPSARSTNPPDPSSRPSSPQPPLRRPTPAPAPSPLVAEEIAMRPRPAAAAPASPSAVVIDDAMGRMGGADEFSDPGFGEEADRDLSVVEMLPHEGEPKDGRRTMLIVDDEPEIRLMLRRVFQERGFRIVEADRGLLALR